MATRYVRSTDGSNADDGSTWALAKADLAGVAAIDTAGDRIWVSNNHAESTAGAVTVALAGTNASPVQLLCGNDAAEPPTSLATTGTVTTTGANAITLTGNIYTYGLTFNVGTGATAASIQLATSSDHQTYDSCNFSLVTTAAGSRIIVGHNNVSFVELVNCGFKFGAVGQGVNYGGVVRIRGGSILAGGTTPTSFLAAPGGSGRSTDIIVDSFDFSQASAGMHLQTGGAVGAIGTVMFRNCKLPASWSGSLCSAAPTTPGYRAELWNCDSTDTNYRMWIEDFTGSIKHETTLVKTSGASDGTTPLSWKFVTSADAEYPLQVLRSPEFPSEWIETVGSPVTITVDILHDSVTALTDGEIWIEVQYLGTSGFPLGLFIDDAQADVLATPANQASSSATWTTTGMANPNKQKLEVTFTPQEKGVAMVTVCMAKASYTLYVDPKATLS